MNLDKLTVKKLQKICQKYKIKNYSRLRKNHLINHVKKFLNKDNKNKKIKENNKIIIYTKSTCPFCINAKRLLDENNMKYIEKEVVQNKKYLNEMKRKLSGKITVPQIFIKNKHIGGFSDLQEYLKT